VVDSETVEAARVIAIAHITRIVSETTVVKASAWRIAPARHSKVAARYWPVTRRLALRLFVGVGDLGGGGVAFHIETASNPFAVALVARVVTLKRVTEDVSRLISRFALVIIVGHAVVVFLASCARRAVTRAFAAPVVLVKLIGNSRAAHTFAVGAKADATTIFRSVRTIPQDEVRVLEAHADLSHVAPDHSGDAHCCKSTAHVFAGNAHIADTHTVNLLGRRHEPMP